MGRKIARESTMKLLYQMQLNEDFSQDAVEIFFDNNSLNSEEDAYIREVVNGVKDNIEQIDGFIEKYTEGWKIKRIAKIDLSILRIAIYEILYKQEIPPQVSINEAIDIAKKYSTDESSKFINGLLGTFLKEWEKN